jgi:hypothetical protein
MAGTKLVLRHAKCTNIVPILELEFPASPSRQRRNRGGRLVAWNLLHATRPAAGAAAILICTQFIRH